MTSPTIGDRLGLAFGFAVVPLGLAALFAVMKKPKLATIAGGLGIAAGVVGAVAAQPANPTQPLASKGWGAGLPSWEGLLNAVKGDATIRDDVNAPLVAQGGYAYSDSAFTYNEPIAAPRTTSVRGGVLDSGQRLSGVGGFWGA